MRLNWILIAALCTFAPLAGWAQEAPVSAPAPNSTPTPTPTQEAPTEEESARQLRIYSETLYQGSTGEVRVDAAVGLLLRKDPTSINVLKTALESMENPGATEAVCRALIKCRGLGKSIAPADQFVKPLVAVMGHPSDPLAKLAGEALLLYPFSEVRNELKSLILDPQRDPAARLRGVYALQLRTETEALQILIGLLDDANQEMARAAEKALQESFGIPVGTSRQVWSGIMEQLKNRSPEEIRRERLLRQEMKLREVQAERDRWKKLTLAAMDKEYELLDAAGKSPYLKDKLASDLASIRIWTLQKVGRLTTEIDPEVRSLLLGLISDEDRDVRFQAARTMSVMSVLNPAEKLLDQYQKETDPQVALALFEALGEACFFAFSPGSKIVLTESIRDQTLDIATEYLKSDQASTTKSAAEIIRKLLDLNGLSQEKADRYCALILERYQRTVDTDGVLRGDLLMVMARLSNQGPHKASAGRLYRDSFLAGLQAADNPTVRLASIVGLTGIDKNEAFRVIKESNLVQDSSPAVREKILELATEVGTQGDLEWLFVLLQSNGGSEPYWGTFKSILQHQKVSVFLDWAARFEKQAIRNDWTRYILLEAEKKAAAANQAELVLEVRTKLLQMYIDNNLTEDVHSLGAQLFAGERPDKNLMISYGPGYLKACLNLNQSDAMKAFLTKSLLIGDIDEGSVLVEPIVEALNSEGLAEEKKQAIVDLLKSIAVPVERPQWNAFLSSCAGEAPPADEVVKSPAGPNSVVVQ